VIYKRLACGIDCARKRYEKFSQLTSIEVAKIQRTIAVFEKMA